MSVKHINIVATVDLKKGLGEILYVNPVRAEAGADPSELFAGASPQGMAPSGVVAGALAVHVGAAHFIIRIEDKNGAVLTQIIPHIKTSKCNLRRSSDIEPESVGAVAKKQTTTGMINEFVPFVEGMKAVVLMHDGKEVSRFQDGTAAKLGAGMGLAFREAVDGAAHRLSVSAVAETLPEQGVTFTVQVKPEGTQAWQTITVGRERPDIQLDRNQFPSARKARVRILRSTGFDDEIFAEEEVKLDF
ncbi:hypothetical protein [Pseudomonas sp. NPDC087336]|uniref:hypothetical protein n=1 Tax=Pseudomonas sp. NPDC087336 TaxID=3364436 RepID=UPI003827562A